MDNDVMKHYRLVLIGFGNVGKAFAQLLLRKEDTLREAGITFSVTGIRTGRHGAAIHPDGIDLRKALELLERGRNLDSLSAVKVPVDGAEFIRTCPADVMFETTPVNISDGQPAVDHIRAALMAGMHAVTANKGALVHGYAELTELAKRQGKKFYFESAVMDGAPIFSLFRDTLPLAELRSVRGIFNSTTNYILGKMEQGESFGSAVEYAQEIGIAETDPSGDVDGWDAAIKAAALITVLLQQPFTPQMVDRQGIRAITDAQMDQARREGKRWKLVCDIQIDAAGAVHARVAPEMVGPDSPLYSINGTSSYAQFELDTLPGLGVVESDPTPAATAYGLLADFLNAVR